MNLDDISRQELDDVIHRSINTDCALNKPWYVPTMAENIELNEEVQNIKHEQKNAKKHYRLLTERFTKEQLIKNLQKVAADLGHTPIRKEFDKHPDRICKSEVFVNKNIFQNWTNALLAAGLKPVRRRNRPKEEILELVRSVAEQLGYVPSIYTFLANQNVFSHDNRKFMKRHFGTWLNTLKAAGLKRTKRKEFVVYWTPEPIVKKEIIKAYTVEEAKQKWAKKKRNGKFQRVKAM